jgi:23S rRNA (cytosine1962-C5)-methyltransferase
MAKLQIHPISLKLIKTGHPWITKDKFSSKFPVKEQFLSIYDPHTNKLLGEFIHDPKHPKIVARFWSHEQANFEKTLNGKLEKAYLARQKSNYDRENIYLCFAEADGVGGLYVQKFKDQILIQYQCFFWEKWLGNIVNFYRSIGFESFWTQKRLPGIEKTHPEVYGRASSKKEILVEEFGIKYLIKFKQYHDVGIFTDMSSIRLKLYPYFEKSKRVLNLFSYTGAFSLFSLKASAESVVSVDVSRPFMDWLERNIELNGFDQDKHESFLAPSEKALSIFEKNKRTFDLIVCDPPSFSSDKKKRKSAVDFYRENFEMLCSLLERGGHLILFLNTHQIAANKFKKLFDELLSSDRKMEIVERVKNAEDCPELKGFPEGSYLKGLVFRRNQT